MARSSSSDGMRLKTFEESTRVGSARSVTLRKLITVLNSCTVRHAQTLDRYCYFASEGFRRHKRTISLVCTNVTTGSFEQEKKSTTHPSPSRKSTSHHCLYA